jgi:DNA transformation protein and related proteins
MTARRRITGDRGARRKPRDISRSLKVSDGFKTFVIDQLSSLDNVVPRSMFGGVGLYCRGVFFGIMARDVLYLKADHRNVADYTRAKMKPFKPYNNRPMTMNYYAVPLDVLESGEELVEWAGKAVAAAQEQIKR